MNIVEPIRQKRDLEKIESILKRQNLRDLLIFTIGTNCGLRISDILNLNVGDVRDKEYICITEKKTGKYKRFPINSKLKPMFIKFTQDRKADEPLFLSIFHNRMERTQCYRIVHEACRKADLNTILVRTLSEKLSVIIIIKNSKTLPCFKKSLTILLHK